MHAFPHAMFFIEVHCVIIMTQSSHSHKLTVLLTWFSNRINNAWIRLRVGFEFWCLVCWLGPGNILAFMHLQRLLKIFHEARKVSLGKRLYSRGRKFWEGHKFCMSKTFNQSPLLLKASYKRNKRKKWQASSLYSCFQWRCLKDS